MGQVEQVELVFDSALIIESDKRDARRLVVSAVRPLAGAAVHPVGDDLVVFTGVDAHVWKRPALPAALHVPAVVGSFNFLATVGGDQHGAGIFAGVDTVLGVEFINEESPVVALFRLPVSVDKTLCGSLEFSLTECGHGRWLLGIAINGGDGAAHE